MGVCARHWGRTGQQHCLSAGQECSDLSVWGGLGLASRSCGIAGRTVLPPKGSRQGHWRECLHVVSVHYPEPPTLEQSRPSESRPYHAMHGGGPGPGGGPHSFPHPAPTTGGHGGHPMQHNPNGPPRPQGSPHHHR